MVLQGLGQACDGSAFNKSLLYIGKNVRADLSLSSSLYLSLYPVLGIHSYCSLFCYILYVIVYFIINLINVRIVDYYENIVRLWLPDAFICFGDK